MINFEATGSDVALSNASNTGVDRPVSIWRVRTGKLHVQAAVSGLSDGLVAVRSKLSTKSFSAIARVVLTLGRLASWTGRRLGRLTGFQSHVDALGVEEKEGGGEGG